MRHIKITNLLQKLNSKPINAFNRFAVNQITNKNSNILAANVTKRFSHNDSHNSSSSSQFSSSRNYALFGAISFGTLLIASKIYSNDLLAATVNDDETPVKVEVIEEEIKDGEAPQVEEPVAVVEGDATIQVVVEKKEDEPLPTEVKVEESEQPKEPPRELPEIPNYAQYLIIGGGTAAMAAFKSIRANDPRARVLVVTEEAYKPYMRPPLSKDLWFTEDENLVSQLKFKGWNGAERGLFFLEDEFYVEPKYLNEQENGGVAVATGKRAVKVDAKNKVVLLDNGLEINYDKCLIATGGKPRNLDIFKKDDRFNEKVTVFRNIDDFKKLHDIAKQGKTIAIIGGGFLGSELACALGSFSKRTNGQVIQVFPEQGTLGRVLPAYLSQYTTNIVRGEGVNIITNASLTDAKLDNDKVVLKLEPFNRNADIPSKQWVLADHVVVAVGLDPNVELAEASGFEVDPVHGGYHVNSELQARNNIWVAGDAACFYDIKLGRRRVEHHDHAVVSGRLAGENMTGAAKPYWHQSMFWSDLGPKIGFEAIGLIDSSLPTMGLFAAPDENDSNEAKVPASGDNYAKGVIFYLKNDKPVGILMWNMFKQMPVARKVYCLNIIL